MRYASVCSGIEAASVAWTPLGWTPAWFAEIEPFPCAVLENKFQGTPNLGDITAPDFIERAHDHGSIDVLIGGTPCQSFSVAGRRQGMQDDRGNLTLRYMELVEALRPTWFVWENVPGVMSTHKGRDFGALLGAVADIGYGYAYRVLDAQYFGLAQRRKRVFLVGHSGGTVGPPAKVLALAHGMRRDTAPRREAGEDPAKPIGGSSQSGGYRTTDVETGALITPEVSKPIGDASSQHRGGSKNSLDLETGALIASPVTASAGHHGHSSPRGDGSDNLVVADPISAHEGRTTSHGGNNPRPRNLVIDEQQITSKQCRTQPSHEHAPPLTQAGRHMVWPETAPTVQSRDHKGPASFRDGSLQTAVAFTERTRKDGRNLEHQNDLSYALTNPGAGGRSHCRAMLTPDRYVRRLTPMECERLQGFPDDYTLIEWKGKPASDTQRYKAIGNSMAVPVIRWIGEQIDGTR